MFTNISSRILLNLFIYNFEAFFNSIFENPVCAISPIMRHETEFFDSRSLCKIQFIEGKNIFYVYFFTNIIHEKIKESFCNYLKSNARDIAVIFNFIFKKTYKINILTIDKENENSKEMANNLLRIDFSIKSKNYDYYYSIILSSEFTNLFKINYKNFDLESAEKTIINFFNTPYNLFPNLKVVLETLNEIEIKKLFYHLMKNNRLSVYQISLMLHSLPQHTKLIKKSLSFNIVSDIDKMMRKLDVNKRDIIGGIYSIEESIYFLMRKNEDFSYSTFISEIYKRLKIFLNCQATLTKKFEKWVLDFDASKHLYQILSITKDDIIANAISENPEFYYNIFSGCISLSRLKDIISLAENKRVSYFEKIESQAFIISSFKRFKINNLNPGHKNFISLLSNLKGNEINHLLLGIGWFNLSTALKNVDQKIVSTIIKKVPIAAKYLIIDVLQGVINPNIIHDEIQINKARSKCIKELFLMYENGIIDLL